MSKFTYSVYNNTNHLFTIYESIHLFTAEKWKNITKAKQTKLSSSN